MNLKKLSDLISQGATLTPMLEQYWNIRKNLTQELLFFRMGDFYELFFDDAVEASNLLHLTLTYRGKILGHPIPMAGIPHHAASNYLEKLTALGKKVAICEQIENPKNAQGNLVKRAITQMVGPCIPYEIDQLETQSEHRFLGCLYKNHTNIYWSLLDFTTGDFLAGRGQSLQEIHQILQQFRPKEILSFIGQWKKHPLEEYFNTYKEKILLTHLQEDYFSKEIAQSYAFQVFPLLAHDHVLNSHPFSLIPIGVISYYLMAVERQQRFLHLRPLKWYETSDFIIATTSTLKGLEILPKNHDSLTTPCLLTLMDKTLTPMGKRLWKDFFSTPLKNETLLVARQEKIQNLVENFSLCEKLRHFLSEIKDIERLLVKISLQRARPHNLISLAKQLSSLSKALSCFFELSSDIWKNFSPITLEKISTLHDLSSLIFSWLNTDLGASWEKGNLILSGQDEERDKAFNLAHNSQQLLEELQEKYIQETQIQKLKIKQNSVFGYFIEIPKGSAQKAPTTFTRKQTLVNAERYQTPELEKLGIEIALAQETLQEREYSLFQNLCETILDSLSLLQSLSTWIGEIDVFSSLAFCAKEWGLTRPHFAPVNSKKFSIKQGFHPLLKQKFGSTFVSHDLELDDLTYFGLLTGPNMAGKTTLMREVAMIQYLAQIGSFVPAQRAELSLVEGIFARLGANDDIYQGLSTFMVEMTEMAEILRYATKNSLILLDEIGRGTSTYDGLALAWAISEHLCLNTKSTVLFATHYHELIELITELPGAQNFSMGVQLSRDNLTFLHTLLKEGATKSYGTYVATLAGISPSLVFRAKELIELFEKGGNHLVPTSSLHPSSSMKKNPEEIFFAIEEILEMDVLSSPPLEILLKISTWQKKWKQFFSPSTETSGDKGNNLPYQ